MHALVRLFGALLLVLAASSPGNGQQVEFIVRKNGKIVGGITALRKPQEKRTVYAVSSYSELDLVKKQVVQSSLGIEYRNGRPYSCFTSFRLNGGLRDSSQMHKTEEGLACFVYPRERFLLNSTPAWTTARMYFEEPVDQTTIFVESVLRECALSRQAPGVYVLDLPGNKSNTYHYVKGALQEVEVVRPMLNLVFRRRL